MKSQPETAESLVPTRVVAELLGSTPETVRRRFITHRQDGDPAPVRLSTGSRARLRWRLSDVEAWIARQADPDHSQPSSPAPVPRRPRYQDRRW